MWLKGGKEAWLAWRKEQAEKRREEDRNRVEPEWMKELRRESLIDREVRYPPLSPEERKAEQEYQKEWQAKKVTNHIGSSTRREANQKESRRSWPDYLRRTPSIFRRASAPFCKRDRKSAG